MRVQPYLFLDGRCEEALAFYKNAIGAEVEMMMRFGEGPDQSMCAPGAEQKVMHAQFKVGDTTVMMSDGQNTGNPKFEGFALTVTAKDEAEVDRLFNALADGGNVTTPLTQTFFSPRFGTLADRFGVRWMVLVAM